MAGAARTPARSARDTTSARHPVQQLVQVAGCACAGAMLALATWSPGRSPAAGVLFPLLWVVAPSRTCAFVLAAAYSMGVVRFLPAFAGNWFGSTLAGAACWMCIGLVSGAFHAWLWPRCNRARAVMVAALAVLLLTLLPPVGAVLPAHPAVSWGFLLPGTGWTGVGLMVMSTGAGAMCLRVVLPRWPGWRPWAAWLLLLTAALVLSTRCTVMGQDDNRASQSVLAVQTRWGGFPPYGSLEAVLRFERIAAVLQAQRDDQRAPATIVFPEAIVGLYDATLAPVLALEVVAHLRHSGQTVVLGADISDGHGGFYNAAMLVRPDASMTILAARQAAPFAQWRPWSEHAHFPADWLAPSTIGIGDGLRARVMFCHEEWMPALHLLSEAREPHQVVIAMANLWAAPDPLASAIQGAHTQGMALLFGKPYVRAVNAAAVQTQPRSSAAP